MPFKDIVSCIYRFLTSYTNQNGGVSFSGPSLLTVSLSPPTQPFVLTAATTSSCSTRKGSVPETCTPSSWRWPMRKYDLWPLWRLLNTQPFFFSVFFFLLSFGWEGGRRNLVAHAVSTDSVGEHQVKGGRRKEKHRLGNDDHLEAQRRGCRLFSVRVFDSRGLSLDRGWGGGERMLELPPNRLLEKRGSVIFVNEPHAAF